MNESPSEVQNSVTDDMKMQINKLARLHALCKYQEEVLKNLSNDGRLVRLAMNQVQRDMKRVEQTFQNRGLPVNADILNSVTSKDTFDMRDLKESLPAASDSISMVQIKRPTDNSACSSPILKARIFGTLSRFRNFEMPNSVTYPRRLGHGTSPVLHRSGIRMSKRQIILFSEAPSYPQKESKDVPNSPMLKKHKTPAVVRSFGLLSLSDRKQVDESLFSSKTLKKKESSSETLIDEQPNEKRMEGQVSVVKNNQQVDEFSQSNEKRMEGQVSVVKNNQQVDEFSVKFFLMKTLADRQRKMRIARRMNLMNKRRNISEHKALSAGMEASVDRINASKPSSGASYSSPRRIPEILDMVKARIQEEKSFLENLGPSPFGRYMSNIQQFNPQNDKVVPD